MPTRGINDEKDKVVAQARSLHMKILMVEFESMYMKLQLNRMRPGSFVNFLLPLLMYYGAGNPLRDDLHNHRWLASCVTSSKHHEDARVFHQDPIRNIEVLENFLKLQFCKIFGSHLLQNSFTCSIIYLLYNDALEKKASAYDSKDNTGSSGIDDVGIDDEVVTEINEAENDYMEGVYGYAWRRYCEQ